MTQANFPGISPTASIATTLLQRKQMNRQRFDSADYAMAMQHQRQFAETNFPLPDAPRQRDSDEFSDWVECELEPEPEPFVEVAKPEPLVTDPSQVPPQRVQRVQLQRFDSADWAMKQAQERLPPTEGVSSVTHTVAKIRLDRHSYQVCSFVETPVDSKSQNFVKNA